MVLNALLGAPDIHPGRVAVEGSSMPEGDRQGGRSLKMGFGSTSTVGGWKSTMPSKVQARVSIHQLA